MRLGVLGVVLALAASASAQGNRPAGPPPGRLVDVGGRAVHVRCVGPASGGPTIILEAGGGAYSTVWSAVQERLAPRLRSCAHDRAGFGWSAGSQQSMAQDNADLRALLTARISTNSKLVRDPSSGHDIAVDNTALVVQVIEEVVKAATTGTSLPH